MPRLAFLFATLFLLAGCGNDSTVRERTFEGGSRGKPRWMGAYVTSAEQLTALKGRGMVTLRFLPDGRAELEARDFDFPSLVWIARARATSTRWNTQRLSCERIVVFHREPSEGKSELLFSLGQGGAERRRGDATTLVELDRFRADSPILKEGLPKALLSCDKTPLTLTRRVLSGGRLELSLEAPGEQAIRYTDVHDPSLVLAVDRLPRPHDTFEIWKPAERVASLRQGLVLADPRNDFVSSPHTHRYYLLPRLVRLNSSDNRIVLRWTKGARPDFRKSPERALDGYTYFEIELGRWQELGPSRWRVSSGGPYDEGAVPALEGTAGGEITLSSTAGTEGFAKGNLEIGYEIPGGTGEVIWQTVPSVATTDKDGPVFHVQMP